MYPTLSAMGQERFTNATGFAGRESSFVAQVVLAIRLDYSSWANTKVQKAAQNVETIRAERTRRQVEDAIFDAYQRVSLGLVKSASARAQSHAAEKAADLANERYRAGALTQLDVTQSMRDLFSAQATSIQADADLAYARVALRSASGQSFTSSTPSK
jgi:outer membrane protein TolC